MLTFGAPLKVADLKAAGDTYRVSGYVSTYNTVDLGNDVVMPGAFDRTLADGHKIRFLAHHRPDQVLGVPESLKSDKRGLLGTFRISKTQLGEETYQLLKDGALDSFSIGYIPRDYEFSDRGDVRQLKDLDLIEASVVSVPMNPDAVVTAVKEWADNLKATWDTAYVNNLPDSAFALVYTDDSGAKQRKLPHHDSSGSVDMPHLRNAMSRGPQMTGVSDAQMQRAMAHLQRHMDAASNAGDHDNYEHHSFTELVNETERVLDALGHSAQHLLATLTDADAALTESKRQELERFLGTFPGLDAVRTDVQHLLQTQPAEKGVAGLVLRHQLRKRLAEARIRGVLAEERTA